MLKRWVDKFSSLLLLFSIKPYKCSNYYVFLKSELKKACLKKRKKGKKSQPKKIGKKRTGKYMETMIFCIFPCFICSC